MTAGEASPAEALSTPKPHDGLLKAYLSLLFGVSCIGFSGVFTRWAESPGVVTATWRVGVATLILAIPFFRQAPADRPVNHASLKWALLGGLLFALDLGLWSAAMDYVSAANAAFIGNISPLWVGLITLFLLRRKLPRLFWPGIAVALVGVGIMMFSSAANPEIRQGDLMALAASVFWAGYQVVTWRAREKFSNLTYLWLNGAFSLILLLPILPMNGFPLFDYDAATIVALIGAGLISQVGGYLGINYSLGKLSAARVSATILLQPVITAVLAFILLGEAFGGWRLIGGALILAGVYLVNRSRAEEGT